MGSAQALPPTFHAFLPVGDAHTHVTNAPDRLAHGTVLAWDTGSKAVWEVVGEREGQPIFDISHYEQVQFPRMWCGTCQRAAMIRNGKCPTCHRHMPASEPRKVHKVEGPRERPNAQTWKGKPIP